MQYVIVFFNAYNTPNTDKHFPICHRQIKRLVFTSETGLFSVYSQVVII